MSIKMKETLRKFYYTPTDKIENDNSKDIHIEGSSMVMHETLCGSVDTFQEQVDTDKMPTCGGCLDVYNKIKNGKLRN